MNKHRDFLLGTASDASLGLKLASEAVKETATVDIAPGKPKKVHATTKEEFQMKELMEPVIRKQPDGCWKYDEGWSDHRIATNIGREGINANHVGRVRGIFFGSLINSKPPTKKSDVEKRLEMLEQAFNHLAAEIGSDLRIASPAPVVRSGPQWPPKD